MMTTLPLSVRLVVCLESLGVREEVVGDLLEEIDSGRPRTWICGQLAGLYVNALAANLRARVRVTPQAVALTLCAILVAGVRFAPANHVLAFWLGCYYAAGALSLFAHMASPTAPADRE